mmetsp:Transcript_64391/g.141176  ORF Transcript_64391/g.141176 Transcript_64391/m.141176 type:complete len:242 (+) Transcript_64391:726-1451(+)
MCSSLPSSSSPSMSRNCPAWPAKKKSRLSPDLASCTSHCMDFRMFFRVGASCATGQPPDFLASVKIFSSGVLTFACCNATRMSSKAPTDPRRTSRLPSMGMLCLLLWYVGATRTAFTTGASSGTAGAAGIGCWFGKGSMPSSIHGMAPQSGSSSPPLLAISASTKASSSASVSGLKAGSVFKASPISMRWSPKMWTIPMARISSSSNCSSFRRNSSSESISAADVSGAAQHDSIKLALFYL